MRTFTLFTADFFWVILAALALQTSALASLDQQSSSFGDRFRDFTETRARPISEAHFRADNLDRWVRAHEGSALEALTRLESISLRLTRISLPKMDAPTDPKLTVQELSKIHQNLTELLSIEESLEWLRQSVAVWEMACESRALYEQAGIDRVATEPPKIPKINPNWTIYASNNLLDTVWTLLNTNSTAARTQQQHGMMEAALERYQALAIQGDEAFAISKTICLEQLKPYLKIRESILSAAHNVKSTLTSTRLFMQKRQRILERAILPDQIQLLLDKNGDLQSLLDLEKMRNSSRLKTDIGTLKLRISDLKERIDFSKNCDIKMDALEEMEDLLVVAQIQLREIPEAHAPPWLEQELSHVRHSLDSMNPRSCR